MFKSLCFRLQIKDIVDGEMKAANQHMAFGVTSLVLVLIISPVIIFLVGIFFEIHDSAN